MNRTETAAWGAVGALTFLVLAVPYRAVTEGGPALPTLAVAAVLVGVGAAALARAAEPHLRPDRRD